MQFKLILLHTFKLPLTVDPKIWTNLTLYFLSFFNLCNGKWKKIGQVRQTTISIAVKPAQAARKQAYMALREAFSRSSVSSWIRLSRSADSVSLRASSLRISSIA